MTIINNNINHNPELVTVSSPSSDFHLLKIWWKPPTATSRKVLTLGLWLSKQYIQLPPLPGTSWVPPSSSKLSSKFRTPWIWGPSSASGRPLFPQVMVVTHGFITWGYGPWNVESSSWKMGGASVGSLLIGLCLLCSFDVGSSIFFGTCGKSQHLVINLIFFAQILQWKLVIVTVFIAKLFNPGLPIKISWEVTRCHHVTLLTPHKIKLIKRLQQCRRWSNQKSKGETHEPCNNLPQFLKPSQLISTQNISCNHSISIHLNPLHSFSLHIFFFLWVSSSTPPIIKSQPLQGCKSKCKLFRVGFPPPTSVGR